MGRRPGIDGRELILAAAFQLFAEQGIDAVSIRAVNREAGLGPASVHYHFGTKEALVDAVIDTYGDSVIESIKSRAQEIVASKQPATARDLVTMLAEPYVHLLSAHRHDGHAWLRIVSAVAHSQPDRLLDRSSTRLTRSAAQHVYPDTSPERIRRAMQMCSTLLITHLASEKGSRRTAGHDLDLLIDFLTAGLDGALTGAGSSASHSSTAS
ncbi:MAG: TetR family transcriptional regulator [Marmoricola sp.]